MKLSVLLVLSLLILKVQAQDLLTYQKPSSEILELVDVVRAPSVYVSNNKDFMIFMYRDAYKSIEELSQKELRLGGLRINPKTNIGSRASYINNVKIKSLVDKNPELIQIKYLPKNAKMANFSFSLNQKNIAFTNTVANGVEVWVIDVELKSAKKLTEAIVNANIGDVINWFEDGNSMLVKMIPSNRKALIATDNAVPQGPTISTNDGKKAQNRTYQDLLKNANDEFNFEQLALSELYRISLDGKKEKWLDADMYRGVTFSPDGEYVMITKIEKPFSYLVPYHKFPFATTIYTKEGKKVKTVLQVPLIEDLPKGYMAVRKGKRSLRWRSDMPSVLVYAQALDGGDPAVEVDFRDEIFQLEAPFSGDGKSIMKTINRFSTIIWGTNKIAIAYDYWWNTRNTKTYLFNPSKASQKPVILYDRNYQDRYSEPGNFVTKKNDMGSYVLAMKKNNAFLLGAGYTKNGQFPFVDMLNLKTKKTKRIYESTYTNKIENLYNYDVEKNELLVKIESASDYPNYFIHDIKNNKLKQLTDFENPFKSIQNIHKEVITYKREDGLELTGTLYLPIGYDMDKKDKKPMILWAYPQEYKSKSSASQKTSNPNKFTYPYYGSPIYWVAKGYVVLNNASFPIVGEGDVEPNNSFIKQLVSNAKAAIDAVDKLGYIDRNRVAVGGHSYGAFMVANLLTHSDLFAAGIARSGAYNRTLTPFGFQSEERNYWEAPEIYNTMSPFMHADKMKTPLLLIHGEADNNSGTYPMQSKRYFNALKGLGATVRLVILPNESHGYAAKESILHLLWEQDQWLDKYVKNRKYDEKK